MKAVSALLALAVAGLVTVGVVKIRHDYLLAGTELIGWAFVPLAILLGFTFPARCKVKTGRRKPCKNDSYGFLFGCNRYGHWKEKFLVRLGWRGEAKPVERRQPKGSYALAYQPAPQSQPVRVTVEDNGLAKCAAYAGILSFLAGVAQVVIAVIALH
ncbi:MAG TPA: hypothetical protein VGR71_17585 [Nitrospira sp.]|nr:hypothetical protein [Nitrospira sp.]